MRRFFLCFLFGLSFNVFAQYNFDAQASSKGKPPAFYAGLHMGATTGRGLSFRYRKEMGLGVQATFWPISKSREYFPGITFVYEVVHRDYYVYPFPNKMECSLYLYQGNSVGRVDYYTDKKNALNNSIGLGAEFFILRNFGCNAMFGIAAYDGFRKAGSTAEFGAYYRF